MTTTTPFLEFKAWPKIARLNRDIIITEKIDGSNAAVIVKQVPEDMDDLDVLDLAEQGLIVDVCDVTYVVGAQSRKRLITPVDDNFAFAAWVWRNAEALASALGEGHHYGEWWGSGIQRGYGLTKGEKRFSLFNVKRYGEINFNAFGLSNVSTVPVIYEGPFHTEVVRNVLIGLRRSGSYTTVPAHYAHVEGIVVFHTASGHVYKVLSENDEISKTEAGAA